MSLMKETTSQNGVFNQVTSNAVVCQNIVTPQFQLLPAPAAENYVLAADASGNGSWQYPTLFAYGMLGGSDSVSITNGDPISFSLLNFPSSGFLSQNATSFTIQQQGVYELNLFALGFNGSDAGLTDPILIQLYVSGDNVQPYQAQSAVATTDTGLMTCSASWIVPLNEFDIVSLINVTGTSLQFPAVVAGLNRTFSLKLIG